jgi:hypothetical protein
MASRAHGLQGLAAARGCSRCLLQGLAWELAGSTAVSTTACTTGAGPAVLYGQIYDIYIYFPNNFLTSLRGSPWQLRPGGGGGWALRSSSRGGSTELAPNPGGF